MTTGDCHFCGEVLPAHAIKFCPSCGNRLLAAPPTPPVTQSAPEPPVDSSTTPSQLGISESATLALPELASVLPSEWLESPSGRDTEPGPSDPTVLTTAASGPSSEPISDIPRCPGCGAEVGADWRKCPECKTALGGSVPTISLPIQAHGARGDEEAAQLRQLEEIKEERHRLELELERARLVAFSVTEDDDSEQPVPTASVSATLFPVAATVAPVAPERAVEQQSDGVEGTGSGDIAAALLMPEAEIEFMGGGPNDPVGGAEPVAAFDSRPEESKGVPAMAEAAAVSEVRDFDEEASAALLSEAAVANSNEFARPSRNSAGTARQLAAASAVPEPSNARTTIMWGVIAAALVAVGGVGAFLFRSHGSQPAAPPSVANAPSPGPAPGSPSPPAPLPTPQPTPVQQSPAQHVPVQPVGSPAPSRPAKDSSTNGQIQAISNAMAGVWHYALPGSGPSADREAFADLRPLSPLEFEGRDSDEVPGVWHGQIVAQGESRLIVMTRQAGSKYYVIAGRLVDSGSVAGVWYDSQGARGTFTMRRNP